MKNEFEERLKGGHPNSLGNTVEVVEEVLSDKNRFDELFNCYYSDDEIVRLRTSSAMKRICLADQSILLPYLDKIIYDISKINQASTQWTLAILFELLEKKMSSKQILRAKEIMKNNIENHNDWIVLIQSMNTLVLWSKNDQELQKWIIPQLERLKEDKRKSVSNKAKKFLAKINYD